MPTLIPISPEIPSLLEVAIKALQVLGPLAAAGVFLWQYKRANEQRIIEDDKRDLELTRSHVALSRELLDNLFSDPLSRDALRMLDWNARKYRVGDELLTITYRDVVNGLRVTSERPEPRQSGNGDSTSTEESVGRWQFSEEEQYVRDCFERLYDQFDLIHHFIGRKLLDLQDLKAPLAYYVAKIKSNLGRSDRFMDVFLQEYGYTLTIEFLKDFP